jgi:N-acetyl-anhydromuramyl-L-alanine amidase AmpD
MDARIISIDVEHAVCDSDWPDPQVLELGRLIAHIWARHGHTPCMSLAAVARPRGRVTGGETFPWLEVYAAAFRIHPEPYGPLLRWTDQDGLCVRPA